MTVRVRAVAALVSLALVATGCESGAGGPGRSSGAAPLPTAVQRVPAKPPATAAALAEQMRRGLAVTGSARVSIAGDAVRGSGVVTLVGGRLTGFRVDGHAGAGSVRMVRVNSVSYLRRGAGHWRAAPRATAVRAVARLAAPSAVLALVRRGPVRLLGRGRQAGVPAVHYRVARTLDLWVDGGGRPVLVHRSGAATVRFGAFNRPVTLRAPALRT